MRQVKYVAYTGETKMNIYFSHNFSIENSCKRDDRLWGHAIRSAGLEWGSACHVSKSSNEF